MSATDDVRTLAPADVESALDVPGCDGSYAFRNVLFRDGGECLRLGRLAKVFA